MVGRTGYRDLMVRKGTEVAPRRNQVARHRFQNKVGFTEKSPCPWETSIVSFSFFTRQMNQRVDCTQ